MIWSRREQRHVALVLTTQGRALGFTCARIRAGTDQGDRDDPRAIPPPHLPTAAHVIRFGARGVDMQGVVAGTEQAGGCLRYLVKYLTKSIGDRHQKVIQ